MQVRLKRIGNTKSAISRGEPTEITLEYAEKMLTLDGITEDAEIATADTKTINTKSQMSKKEQTVKSAISLKIEEEEGENKGIKTTIDDKKENEDDNNSKTAMTKSLNTMEEV